MAGAHLIAVSDRSISLSVTAGFVANIESNGLVSSLDVVVLSISLGLPISVVWEQEGSGIQGYAVDPVKETRSGHESNI